MFTIKHTGNFNKTERFMSAALRVKYQSILESYGAKGVDVLAAATPIDTGKTAGLWSYKVSVTKKGYNISWSNSNSEFGVPVVVLIQYGHGTSGGAYVQGIDFINPAMAPILNGLAQNLLREVSNL
jgi:hypothetical protein